MSQFTKPLLFFAAPRARAGLARTVFKQDRARALFAGVCAHSTLTLEPPLSPAFGLILGAAGHAVGWPVAAGGSQQIANALAGVLASLGGTIKTSSRVESLSPGLTLCD